MNDFIFYKKRGFSALIGDTFTFFKKYARNFFSNYLIVNGAIFAAVGIIAVAMFALYASSRSSIGFGPTALLVLVLLLFLAQGEQGVLFGHLQPHAPLAAGFGNKADLFAVFFDQGGLQVFR